MALIPLSLLCILLSLVMLPVSVRAERDLSLQSRTCTGTEKFSAFDGVTRTFTCSSDQTTGGGGGGTLTTVQEQDVGVGGADIVTLDFLGADFDLTESPDTEINIAIAAALTRDAEWNAIGLVETIWGFNILTSTELDTSAELAALLGDETGTGAACFSIAPTLVTPLLQGVLNYTGTAVDDDDCTGQQGRAWWDSVDLQFEWCNANSGTPTRLGEGGAGADDQTAAEVPVTPTGTLVADDVQEALIELNTEKAGLNEDVIFEDILAVTLELTPKAIPTIPFLDADLLGTDKTAGEISMDCSQTADGSETCAATLTRMLNGTPTPLSLYGPNSGTLAERALFFADHPFVGGETWALTDAVDTGDCTVGNELSDPKFVECIYDPILAEWRPNALLTEQIVSISQIDTEVRDADDNTDLVTHANLPQRTTQTLTADTQSIDPGTVHRANHIHYVQGDAAYNLTSTPQIVAGTDLQVVWFCGSHNTNTITLENGNGISIHSSITLTTTACLLGQYTTASATWNEVTRSGGASVTGTPTLVPFFGAGGTLTSKTGFSFTDASNILDIPAGGQIRVPCSAALQNCGLTNAVETADMWDTLDNGSYAAGVPSSTNRWQTRIGTQTPVNYVANTGGAILSGTAPTVSATNNIAVDTTGGQLVYYDGATVQVSPYRQYIRYAQANPTSDDDLLVARAEVPMTVLAVDCIAQGTAGSTVVMFLQECNANGGSCTTTESLTCGLTNTADNGIDAPTIEAGNWMQFNTSTVTGSVTQIAIQAIWKETRQ